MLISKLHSPLDGIQIIVVTFARLISEFYVGEQHKQVTLKGKTRQELQVTARQAGAETSPARSAVPQYANKKSRAGLLRVTSCKSVVMR